LLLTKVETFSRKSRPLMIAFVLLATMHGARGADATEQVSLQVPIGGGGWSNPCEAAWVH
jgi:hypothetical protein